MTCTQSHFHKVISFEEAIKGASIYHSCVSLAEHKTLYMYCVTSSASQSDGVKITPPFYRCKKRGSDLLKASQWTDYELESEPKTTSLPSFCPCFLLVLATPSFLLRSLCRKYFVSTSEVRKQMRELQSHSRVLEPGFLILHVTSSLRGDGNGVSPSGFLSSEYGAEILL